MDRIHNLLDDTNEDFSNTLYSSRSRVYDLPSEELQRYFEERTNDIEELENKLDAWHKGKFPLLEIESVKFYIYGWSTSENGNLEIKPIGCKAYYPAKSSPCAPSLQPMTAAFCLTHSSNKPLLAFQVIGRLLASCPTLCRLVQGSFLNFVQHVDFTNLQNNFNHGEISSAWRVVEGIAVICKGSFSKIG